MKSGTLEKTWNETYTCLLPWRLGLGALADDGRPRSESKTSSNVVEPGDGLVPLGDLKDISDTKKFKLKTKFLIILMRVTKFLKRFRLILISLENQEIIFEQFNCKYQNLGIY